MVAGGVWLLSEAVAVAREGPGGQVRQDLLEGAATGRWAAEGVELLGSSSTPSQIWRPNATAMSRQSR